MAVSGVAQYIVYDPPKPGLPYLAALFLPAAPPRVFMFRTAAEAEKFLTRNAVAEIDADGRAFPPNTPALADG